MAMFYSVCSSLYVFLVVFSNISSVLSETDYHFYASNSHHVEEHSVELDLLGRENLKHIDKKRAIPPESLPTPSSNTTENIVPTNESPPTNLPTSTTLNTVKQKTGRDLVPPKLDDVANFTTTVHRNLGENGTGVRLNITTTTLAPILQDKKPNTEAGRLSEVTPGLPDPIDTEDDKSLNETLKNHNLTASKNDTISYYNSTINNDPKVGLYYWVDMTNRSDVKVNDLLSKSHRRAATIKLSFEFPFYGHLIKNVTIATGGFLYTGDYVHSWLAATQYIAPLMANFDTSISNDSLVRYLDNGTAFTVEWKQVKLQDKPEYGPFTFQVTLLKNGDIIFVYKSIPVFIDQITESLHPVKVGLSDAYIMDQTVFLVRRKTIYEYERVHFNKTEIRNITTIYLKALRTCHDFRDCTSCITSKMVKECRWCPSFNKCSVGYDRNRQDWVAHGCENTAFSSIPNLSKCQKYTSHENDDENEILPDTFAGQVIYTKKSGQVGVSGIIAILFLVGMISGLMLWVLYAYRNPHTISGQILIRYRPSQWRWRRGEARYTAATIHM